MAVKPTEVTKVLVNDSKRYEHGGIVTPVRTATYFVGAHGPFYYTSPVGEWSDDKATQDMVNTVTSLRRLGALG